MVARYQPRTQSHHEDLALPMTWARWTARRLDEEGMTLSAALRDERGSWRPCELDELLADGVVASIGQRPSCGSVMTTVHVWDADGLRGAFWLERGPGGFEPMCFRVVLLQALLRASGTHGGA